MSLVQHVSAVEGIDRERDVELDVASLLLSKTLSHKLSYDLLPKHVEHIPEKLDSAAAYEVSTVKRLVQVLVGCITCFLASGVTFGFAALKSILVEEQFYRDLCTKDELDKNVTICYLQDQKLNLMFIVASSTCNVGALLVGTVLDRFGPRICGFISSILLAVGTLCIAFNADLPFDTLIPGNFFLALGGTFVFVPSFHLSNAFPQYQGLILALITGAFDASAAVFLLFRLIYESTSGRFGVRAFFLLYLVVPIFIFITQLLMPSHSYETRTELEVKMEIAEDPTTDLHDSDDDIDDEAELWKIRGDRSVRRRESLNDIRSLLGTQEERINHEKKEEEKKIASGVWGAMHGLPAWKQIQTPWFMLIALFTVLQMALFNFFIATLWTQYRYMLQSAELATQLNDFFDMALPIGGVLTVPFIGLLLDNLSTVVVLGFIVFATTIIGILGATPTLWAAYSKICLFVLLRPLYYSAVSDYVAKVFGFATFGTVYGVIVCLSGAAIFCQPGLQALVHTIYEEDPGPMNLWFAGISMIVGISLVMYVDTRGRKVRAEHADQDERRSMRIGSRRPSRTSLRESVLLDPERRPLLHRGLSTVQEAPNEPQDDAMSIYSSIRGGSVRGGSVRGGM